MTEEPSYIGDRHNGFVDELLAAGVPYGSKDLTKHGVWSNPQLKPIYVDWVQNYRTRLTPGAQWFRFLSALSGYAPPPGEQPEVLAALITEFRNLCDLDFEKVIASELYDPHYKGNFIANFSLAIGYAAGPADYDRLRELFFEPKSKPFRWSLLTRYFGQSKNKDLPNILAESFKSTLGLPAAHIAALRGFTQFLPEVREVARRYENDPDIEWREQTSGDLYRLEKKDYANTHKGTNTDDLIRDLDDDSVAPYAAHVLGARKDPAALEALRRKTTSPITRLRQEAKAAVKKSKDTPGEAWCARSIPPYSACAR